MKSAKGRVKVSGRGTSCWNGLLADRQRNLPYSGRAVGLSLIAPRAFFLSREIRLKAQFDELRRHSFMHPSC